MGRAMKIKKGDTAVVISGKDKGQEGKVLRVFPKTGKIVLEGVNMVHRHMKPRGTAQGGIVKQEAQFEASNVMVVCPKCSKGTRVGHKIEDGKKTRVCKKCGAEL